MMTTILDIDDFETALPYTRKLGDTFQLSSIIQQCTRAVVSSFTYVDNAAEYVDRLRALERQPESLEDVINRRRSKL